MNEKYIAEKYIEKLINDIQDFHLENIDKECCIVVNARTRDHLKNYTVKGIFEREGILLDHLPFVSFCGFPIEIDNSMRILDYKFKTLEDNGNIRS